MEDVTIKQGETLVYLARPNTLDGSASLSGWTCSARLETAAGAESIAAYSVTGTYTLDGVNYFLPFVTSAQTAALAVGIYRWAIDISNPNVDPPYAKESHVNVAVLAQSLP